MIPAFQFADRVGPPRRWFAWRPVRTFDGCLVWLRVVVRFRMQTKEYLPWPHRQWWAYAYPSDLTTTGAPRP